MSGNRLFSRGAISRKLTGLVLAALAASFLVTAVVATLTDVQRQADLETERLTQTARVIASLAADSVQAQDPGGAFRAIRSVSQMPDVSYGRLMRADGRLLAETGGGARLVSDVSLDDSGGASIWSLMNTGSIQVSQPVMNNGQSVGEIVLFSRTPELRDRILSTVWTTFAGAGVALLVGLLVAIRMARRISSPIVALADAIGEMQRTQTYERQAEIVADGEVGELVTGFNRMLDGIRERDVRIQAQVEGLEQEVAARTAELSLAKDSAESANAAKSDFLAVMSHEIRTPMNGILALSDMLAKSDLSSRQQRYANVRAKSGRSLLTIINDILDFSKVEAGKMDLEQIEVDLAEVAEDVASLFSERALEKGLDLAVYIDPTLPHVLADPVRLRQVVGNLTNNAIKFTEAGGVLISIAPNPRAADQILFSITDTGPGIAEDKLPTLFEAFSQADQSTTRKYGGTGLGLAICDRLVRAMGGEWRLASKVGRGSTFAFTVPLPHAATAVERLMFRADWTIQIGDQFGQGSRTALAKYAKALGITPVADGSAEAAFVGASHHHGGSLTVIVCADEAEAAAVLDRTPDACVMVKPLRQADVLTVLAQMHAGETPRLNAIQASTDAGLIFPGARVLVVDDSDVNREVAGEALRMLGVEAAMANDGIEAVEALRTQAFDLVLMDGSMPRMDGFEATRIIRHEEAEQAGRVRATIVALTAHVVGAGADAWKAAGMDGVIHKPFTLDDLTKVLLKVCGDRARAPGASDALPAAVQIDALDDPLFDPAVRAELDTLARNGKADFVERVQGLYATNAPLRLAEIDQALVDGDAEAMARAAHALKSMSLSLGARAVAELSSAMETSARSGETVGREAVAQIRSLFDQTLAKMGGAASTPQPPTIEQELKTGIERGELSVVYQAIMDRSGVFANKVEALIRWNHAEHGRMSPDDFVPRLEASGSISRLTDFVMMRAMQECRDIADLVVSINAAPSEFQRTDFTDRVVAAASQADFPLSRLEIEVTETAMLDVPAVARTITTLRAMSVGVALDDFGAGFTSLHALKELKFTTLKVDRSFVDECTADTASAAIIHAVIGVGRALGMKVTCEGIETAKQAEFLRIAGAHLLQGYYFQKPCEAADLPRKIAA